MDIELIVKDRIYLKEELKGNRVFVYGTQVDDKRTVNKDNIFTVAVSALKELDKTVQTQQNEIAELKQLVQSLLENQTRILSKLNM